MGIERRKFERVPSRLAVRYGYVTLDREGIADNVSEGGLFIRTNQVFPMGTHLRLEVDFPERTIQQSGEVMWAIKVPEHQVETMICGMGIRFVDTEPGWPEFFRRWMADVTAGAG
jgi:uncharacterized protein (TIGR02266 family)